MQQQQYEARASREASKTVRIHRCRWKYSSATNSNDKNLSQGSFTKQQHWGDKVSREAERQRNGESSSGESMRTCKARMWRQLVKQTVLQGPAFRFCEFPSLRTTPWISRRTLSEEHVERSWKGASLIWESPIAYLVFLTISFNFRKPMSVPYMFSIAGVFAVAHIVTICLTNHDSRVRSQWGRYNLPRFIDFNWLLGHIATINRSVAASRPWSGSLVPIRSGAVKDPPLLMGKSTISTGPFSIANC